MANRSFHVGRIATAASGFLLAFHPASAATLVAPNNLANQNAGGGNAFPLVGSEFMGGGSAVAIRYEEVFAASQFSAFGPGGGLITALAFRPAGSKTPTAASLSYASCQLTLSTTAAAPDALSTTVASNLGSDARQVYSGPITFATAESGPVGGPFLFDLTIPLQTPFIYDPALVNLIFDLRLSGPDASSILVDDRSVTGDSVSRLIAVYGVDNPNGPSGRASTNGAPVQFTFTSVPEPGAWTFLLFGAAALTSTRLSRRSRNATEPRDVRRG